MQTDCSLPSWSYSQDSGIGLYAVPKESVPQILTLYIFKILFNIILPSTSTSILSLRYWNRYCVTKHQCLIPVTICAFLQHVIIESYDGPFLLRHILQRAALSESIGCKDLRSANQSAVKTRRPLPTLLGSSIVTFKEAWNPVSFHIARHEHICIGLWLPVSDCWMLKDRVLDLSRGRHFFRYQHRVQAFSGSNPSHPEGTETHLSWNKPSGAFTP